LNGSILAPPIAHIGGKLIHQAQRASRRGSLV